MLKFLVKLILLTFLHQVYLTKHYFTINHFFPILAGQRWMFQLYEHIYSDRVEVNAEVNQSKTQTTIELRLYKQQIHTTWPQLCSRHSTPLIQQGHDRNIDMIDQQINSYELSTKKITTNFTETNDNKAISQIQIKEVYNCQVQFTETNFTVVFHTKFDEILFFYI